MMKRLISWLQDRFSDADPDPEQDLRSTGAYPFPSQDAGEKDPRPEPEYVEVDSSLHSEIESNGPGKNVLIRNKYHREETGTHETLKILDDSLVDSGEEPGIDPYNTGGFDRSRNWDQRFRK